MCVCVFVIKNWNFVCRINLFGTRQSEHDAQQRSRNKISSSNNFNALPFLLHAYINQCLNDRCCLFDIDASLRFASVCFNYTHAQIHAAVRPWPTEWRACEEATSTDDVCACFRYRSETRFNGTNTQKKKTVNNCWTFFEYFIFVFVVLVGLHWFVTLLVLKHACFPIILRIVSLHTIYNNHYIIFSVQIIFICRAQIAQPGMCKEFIHYITSLHITNKPGVQWQKTIENFVSFPRRIRSRGKFAHSCWQLCRMCQKCVCILLGFDSAFGSGLSPTLSVAHCGPTASCINDITSQPT